MIIAYLLMNYDIRHMPERPKTRWIGRYIIPRVDVKIGLRRRKVPVDGWLH